MILFHTCSVWCQPISRYVGTRIDSQNELSKCEIVCGKAIGVHADNTHMHTCTTGFDFYISLKIIIRKHCEECTYRIWDVCLGMLVCVWIRGKQAWRNCTIEQIGFIVYQMKTSYVCIHPVCLRLDHISTFELCWTTKVGAN